MTTNIPIQGSLRVGEGGPASQLPSLKGFSPIKRTFWQQVGHDIKKSNKWGYVFIAPLVIDFLVFTLYLIVHAFIYSFQDIEFGKTIWVGLTDYRILLRTPLFSIHSRIPLFIPFLSCRGASWWL